MYKQTAPSIVVPTVEDGAVLITLPPLPGPKDRDKSCPKAALSIPYLLAKAIVKKLLR